MVRTHPETGERMLYVNCSFTRSIKGLSKKESDWLLHHLYDQASIPEYQVRFRWRAEFDRLLGQPLVPALRRRRLPPRPCARSSG